MCGNHPAKFFPPLFAGISTATTTPIIINPLSSDQASLSLSRYPFADLAIKTAQCVSFDGPVASQEQQLPLWTGCPVTARRLSTHGQKQSEPEAKHLRGAQNTHAHLTRPSGGQRSAPL